MAYQRSSLILRCFKCRDPSCYTELLLYSVKPVLEYCQVWSPAYLYLVDTIEWYRKVLLNGLSAMSYSDRLIWSVADSLATSRLKFDLVLLHDNIAVDLPLFGIVDPLVTHTRGHSFRIIKQQCRITARLNYSLLAEMSTTGIH